MPRKKSKITNTDTPKTTKKSSKSKRTKRRSTIVKALDKPDKKSIEGNWIIKDEHTHFATLIGAAVAEKRKLVKEKKFKKNKNKKLRYTLTGEKFKKSKKNEKSKHVINVYFN